MTHLTSRYGLHSYAKSLRIHITDTFLDFQLLKGISINFLFRFISAINLRCSSKFSAKKLIDNLILPGNSKVESNYGIVNGLSDNKEKKKLLCSPKEERNNDNYYSNPENRQSNKGLEKTSSILFVGGSQYAVKSISGLLPNEFKIYSASNGQEGIERATQKPPDVTIIDLQNGLLDGLSFCMKMKLDVKLSQSLIVLISNIDLEDSSKALNISNADIFMTKPIDFEVLKSLIYVLLSTKSKLHIKGFNFFDSSLRFKAISGVRNFRKITDSNDENSINKDDSLFLNKVNTIISSNLSNFDFCVSDLERKMTMSHSAFYRNIFRLTGMSGSELITKYKVSMAINLLHNSSMTIKEIAFQVGYSDPLYFSKVFKKVHGVSPTKYRKEINP